MSMKYEGDGIMLNIDRIVRMVFAEGLEGDVRTATELRQTGRTSIYVRLDTLERTPWANYDLTSMKDEARQGWVIFITDRSWRPPPRLALGDQIVEEAEFTIEDAPAKQLPASTDKCYTCGAVGFGPSKLGPARCTFCDGTEGGNPPE